MVAASRVYTPGAPRHSPNGEGRRRLARGDPDPAPVNTPTHALVSLAALGRRGDRARNAAAVLGAVLPDLPIFVLFVVARYALGQPSGVIWTRTYFEPGWQLAVDVAHSVPLALVGLAVAHARQSGPGRALFASLVLHSALDFPVHTDDAHRHFLPLSTWRFHSPVSYWDPRAYGREVAAVEIAASLVLAVRGYRIVTARLARAAVVTTALVYLVGALVLFRPCVGMPWLAAALGGDPRCAPAARTGPAPR